MSIHSHYALLKKLFDGADAPSDKEPWALAIVLDKTGSSYRRPGAFMLISPLGQSFGLVSGGCLEADIQRRAQQVLQRGQAQYVIYDMLEEESFAAELGIGCSGKIGVLIKPLTPAALGFYRKLLQCLEQGIACRLVQPIPALGWVIDKHVVQLWSAKGEKLAELHGSKLEGTRLSDSAIDDKQPVSDTLIPAPLTLWVMGGGADAQPLVQMATELGWRITLVDHRSSYGRRSVFPRADTIIREHPDSFSFAEQLQAADAVILMTHNLALDAAWLNHLQHCRDIQYIGLLGPTSRREKVMALCTIVDSESFDKKLHGPAGLALGGELPESIALSILAECHAFLYQRNAAPLNKISVINP